MSDNGMALYKTDHDEMAQEPFYILSADETLLLLYTTSITPPLPASPS